MYWPEIQKIPTIPWIFLTKLQAICRTNAQLLIQILCEHHVWKMSYGTNKLNVSYFVDLPWSNAPDYTYCLTFTWLYPDFGPFPWPQPNSPTFPGFQKSGNLVWSIQTVSGTSCSDIRVWNDITEKHCSRHPNRMPCAQSWLKKMCTIGETAGQNAHFWTIILNNYIVAWTSLKFKWHLRSFRVTHYVILKLNGLVSWRFSSITFHCFTVSSKLTCSENLILHLSLFLSVGLISRL